MTIIRKHALLDDVTTEMQHRAAPTRWGKLSDMLNVNLCDQPAAFSSCNSALKIWAEHEDMFEYNDRIPMWFYIIGDDRHVKCGITANLEKRMAPFATHNATARIIFAVYGFGRKLEDLFKETFRPLLVECRGSTEWFRNEGLLAEFVSHCEDYITQAEKKAIDDALRQLRRDLSLTGDELARHLDPFALA